MLSSGSLQAVPAVSLHTQFNGAACWGEGYILRHERNFASLYWLDMWLRTSSEQDCYKVALLVWKPFSKWHCVKSMDCYCFHLFQVQYHKGPKNVTNLVCWVKLSVYYISSNALKWLVWEMSATLYSAKTVHS